MEFVRAKSNGLRSVRVLYFLLFLWALISVGYYIAGGIAMREEFFHAAKYARLPFGVEDDALTVNYMRQEAKDAGLAYGDVIQTLNGKPYTGYFQRNTELRRARPGDYFDVRVKTSDGRMKEVRIHLVPMEGPGFTFGGYVAFLTPVLGVPLLSLIVGLWVVAARPRDLNAWLVLMVLSFMEASFGNLDWSFWTGGWYLVFWLWYSFLQVMAFPALLWLGIYFPERWRLDRRWPWVKWCILAVAIYELAENLIVPGIQNFAVHSAPSLAGLSIWSDRIGHYMAIICQLIFLVAVFDKLRSASTPDARRRLRVLAIGSGLSLGPLVFMFGVLPYFGIDPGHGSMYEVLIPFVALFPITLAYVLVVQRAMDVRILLRMGTKYLLARVTLIAVESGIAIFLIMRVVLPMMQQRRHQVLNGILLTLILVALFRAFAVRDSLSSRIQRWLDRKFFREAYDSEVVLSELAEHARKFTDTKPLIETVATRISEVLHVPQIVVWLRGSSVFHLQ